MARPVRFLLGHEERVVDGVAPTLSLLDYLRTMEYRRGTKEGCNEGDCGACTVVLGDPTPGGGMRYRAVNACVVFLGMVDGRQVITVEDLTDPGAENGDLHPVQQGLVDHEGSQCGFCTPGFVMSLFAYDKAGGGDDLQAINDCLAGNLCRCTGYGPIIDAARELDGAADQFTARARETAGRLLAMRDEPMLALESAAGRFYAPTDAAELAALLVEAPDARLVAGATDVGLWVTKALNDIPTVIFTGRVAELLTIDDTDTELRLGSAVTYADAHDALVAVFPDLKELLRRLGSTQIRSLGTVGGNLANASPIGDTPPALLVLGTSLVLRKGSETRQVDLEAFFVGPGKTLLVPGEFIETIVIPKPDPATKLRTYKLSKRFDQDISAVCGAFAVTVGGDGGVTAARIAYGGMAATPKRAMHAEQALIGQAWSARNVEAAMAALTEDFKPIRDLRATAEYRMVTAANMLLRVFVETTAPEIETRLVGDPALAHV